MGRKAFIGSELIFSDTVHQFLQVLTLSPKEGKMSVREGGGEMVPTCLFKTGHEPRPQQGGGDQAVGGSTGQGGSKELLADSPVLQHLHEGQGRRDIQRPHQATEGAHKEGGSFQVGREVPRELQQY